MPFRVGTNRIGRLGVGDFRSPANIAKYWWTADSGITESGGRVSSWEDQINGLTIEQSTSADQPLLVTSSNLNNQQAVRFNRASGEWLQRDPISFASDGYAFSVINISYYNMTNSQSVVSQTVAQAGNGRYADLITSGVYGNVARNFYNGSVITLESPPTVGVKVNGFEYDAAGNTRSWFNNLSTVNQTNTGGLSNLNLFQNTFLIFGAYGNSTGTGPDTSRFFDGDLAESIWVPRTLTSTDLRNLQTYINNKYNLSV